MAHACDKFSPLGIEVLVELFNRQDNPDFFISHVSEGLDLLRKASRPNLKIQIDTYHVQIVEGELGPIVSGIWSLSAISRWATCRAGTSRAPGT